MRHRRNNRSSFVFSSFACSAFSVQTSSSNLLELYLPFYCIALLCWLVFFDHIYWKSGSWTTKEHTKWWSGDKKATWMQNKEIQQQRGEKRRRKKEQIWAFLDADSSTALLHWSFFTVMQNITWFISTFGVFLCNGATFAAFPLFTQINKHGQEIDGKNMDINQQL